MANLNKVFLIGNLTRDPELRASQSGLQIAKFGLATNRRRTVNGETVEDTTFVDLTAFGRQAEVIHQYLKKGRPVFIEGRLSYSSWQTDDGQKRNKLEVIVENFQFLGSREGGGQAASQARDSGGGFGEGPGFGQEPAEGEIPF
ncbi:MAG: single-stranded DNA-binding protein [Planctomycetota bacterium]